MRESGDYEILLQRIQDALGTEATGDALVFVARDAHHAERRLASLILAIEEVRDELAEDFDVVDGSDGQPRPNKAMSLSNALGEALYGPGGF